MFIKCTSLDRTCMSAKQDFFGNVESILHVTCWVILRQIHTFKVIVVCFNFKTINNLEAHPQENIFDFFSYLAKNMTVTKVYLATWKGYVKTFRVKLGLNFSCFNNFSCFVKSFSQNVTNFVDHFTNCRAFFTRKVFKSLQKFRQRTFFT